MTAARGLPIADASGEAPGDSSGGRAGVYAEVAAEVSAGVPHEVPVDATGGPAAGSGPVPFGVRLAAAMDALGPLCAGIDPHPALLAAWGLPDSPAGLRRFALACVEAFGGAVAAVKPQSAFFERHGSAGIAVLEEVLAGLRDAGTLCLLDVKRGDIGSTMDAYAQAYLADGAPLRADAVTVSPYLGFGSLRPALDLARRTGRGVFVLALTSNPEGAGVQHATREGISVAAAVASAAAAENARATAEGLAAASGGHETAGARRMGSVGLVVGATVGPAARELGVDLTAVRGPLLAPGIGAQGAAASDLRAVFGDALPHVLPASSRDVLRHGPTVRGLRQAARQAAEELGDVLSRTSGGTSS